MTKRILIIVLSALALVLLVGVLWWMFFSGAAPSAQQTGTFGQGANRSISSGGGGTTGGNIPAPVGQETGTNGLGTGGNVSLGGGSVPLPTIQVASSTGAQWLDTTTGGGAVGGGGASFNPKAINQLNNGSIGGTVSVLGSGGGASAGNSNSGAGIGAALGVVGIGTALCTAGLLSSSLTGGATGGILSSLPTAIAAVQVNSVAGNAIASAQLTDEAVRNNFLNCIARTIAKAALQQITASVVNWINSGFNGSPSFVQNFNKFFTNVADQAAGEYIRGSALSFLCSPFQTQIRIAIAQSYARRNAMTCSLTGVIKNANAFINGNFSAGGWGGLLRFTTVPTNNPYGAFAYAQAGLVYAQQQAVGQKQQELNYGKGFLSYTQDSNCTTESAPPSNTQGKSVTAVPDNSGTVGTGLFRVCDSKIVTPGATIQDSISNTLKVSQDTLSAAGVSGSFDAIISALITQLMVRTLYGGLSNLSGQGGYSANFLTPDQQQAQSSGQALLTDMQGKGQLAQQFGQIAQGSIQDIESMQSQLQSTANCWSTLASSTSSSQKQGAAQTQAQQMLLNLHSFDAQIDTLNNDIMRANASIALLETLQNRVLNISSTATVQAVAADYTAAQNSGKLILQIDVTTEQQNRTTLQAQLSGLNASATDSLSQCYATTP
ncbi:MAG: hypothetical protein KGI70_01315 [Patescibacteria group bacterium]|nr:hypothetical protein [Patescibacteria group bacterium]